jgi:hypothetical protein
MTTRISRRNFVKDTALASAAITVAVGAKSASAQGKAPQEESHPTTGPLPAVKGVLPKGQIAGVEFSRLIMGGNLIGGYAHSRDPRYVGQLMKRYNTEQKILETMELAEINGITAMNSYVMDGNAELQKHWKRGGKMKWFAQVRIDPGGSFSQVKKAVDLGATAIHITGDSADALMEKGQIDKVGEMMDFIKSQKCISGIGAHSLPALVECEKRKFNADFYQKTLHTHDYRSAPGPGETGALGTYDNSWCNDPDEVIEFFWTVKKPFIAFKVMAAGAIPPRKAFQHAFNSGADFVLAGMFDWQVEEDVQIAREVLSEVRRTRAWLG